MYSIRSSLLPTYHDCPRRGIARLFGNEIEERGYVLNQGGGTQSYQALGTSIHSGAAHTLTQKKETGNPCSLSDMVEVSVGSWRKEIAEGVQYDQITNNPNTAEKQIQQISKTYYHLILPDITPIAIEPPLLAKTLHFLLTGHPDVIAEGGIGDLKTGTQKSSYHAQLGAYSLLARSEGYERPKGLSVIHIPRVGKNKNPAEPNVIKLDVGLCERVARHILLRIVEDVEKFKQAKDPLVVPENQGSKLCSPKYCNAHVTDFCPITKG